MKPERRDFLKLGTGALAGGLVVGSLPLPAAEKLPDAAAVTALRKEVRGTVVVRGSATYETWRRSMIWNYRKFMRYPDLIVQAETEDDVVAAINFARRQGLQITSRGGGHSWSGCFLRDGGVLLDLSRLQTLEIDTRARVASVQPGVLGRILNWRLGEVGLAFPTAHCGMVPVSGFLLGGGLGLNSVAWGGMSVFNIQAIDLVNASGERLHASSTENADYFWAARGGGPGLFFTVTRFYLKCYPLPRSITTDTYILPFDKLADLSGAMQELGPRIDQRVEMLTVVVPTPPDMLKQSPSMGARVAVLAATAFADSEPEATTMLTPLAAHPVLQRPLTKIDKRPTPFEVLYQDNEGPFPQRRARADNIYTDRVIDAAEVLSRHMPAAPSSGNTPVILWRGTADFPAAAYSARGSFYFATYAQWDNAADDTANEEWLKSLYAELEPLATGHYINEFDRELHAARTASCFAPANWQRLHELRRQYDPGRVFQDFLGSPV